MHRVHVTPNCSFARVKSNPLYVASFFLPPIPAGSFRHQHLLLPTTQAAQHNTTQHHACVAGGGAGTNRYHDSLGCCAVTSRHPTYQVGMERETACDLPCDFIRTNDPSGPFFFPPSVPHVQLHAPECIPHALFCFPQKQNATIPPPPKKNPNRTSPKSHP